MHQGAGGGAPCRGRAAAGCDLRDERGPGTARPGHPGHKTALSRYVYQGELILKSMLLAIAWRFGGTAHTAFRFTGYPRGREPFGKIGSRERSRPILCETSNASCRGKVLTRASAEHWYLASCERGIARDSRHETLRMIRILRPAINTQ